LIETSTQSITYLFVESFHSDYRLLDNSHTQNEVCLYNDLMAARAELERQKEKIEQLEGEKQEIVAVMHQAAVSLHYFRDFCSYKN